MGTISLTNLPVSGGARTAAQVTNAFNTIQDAINGALDDANVASDAGIAATKLAAVPACRVTNSADLSIPNATETALTFDTETFDNDGIHSTSANTDRLTIATPGLYLITASVSFLANATGYRQVAIKLNGSTKLVVQEAKSNGAGNEDDLSVSTVYALVATDYVTASVYQNSGGSLTLNHASAYSPVFAVVRLSA